jgi:hypothetical protein
MTSNKGPQLNWCGQPMRPGQSYGGRPEERIPSQVIISHKRLQRLDQFRRLINEGTTQCSQIAPAMGVSKYTISRMARRAKKAGWLDTVNRKYAIVNAEE